VKGFGKTSIKIWMGDELFQSAFEARADETSRENEVIKLLAQYRHLKCSEFLLVLESLKHRKIDF
jgi:hypothetical protein